MTTTTMTMTTADDTTTSTTTNSHRLFSPDLFAMLTAGWRFSSAVTYWPRSIVVYLPLPAGSTAYWREMSITPTVYWSMALLYLLLQVTTNLYRLQQQFFTKHCTPLMTTGAQCQIITLTTVTVQQPFTRDNQGQLPPKLSETLTQYSLSLSQWKKKSTEQMIKYINPLQFKGNCSATSNNMKLLHWLLMGGLLLLVQLVGDWMRPQPT